MDVIHGAKSAMGHALRPVHAGNERLILRDARIRAESGAILSMQSTAFEANGPIPRKYSGEGENISPPLRWSGIPSGTQELILVCEDPDAPMPKPYIHWILYGLAPTQTSLPEGIPTTQILQSLGNARQAKNSADKIGYTGPMPPIGHGVHHYHFQLIALDEPIRIGDEPDLKDLATAISSHILATGEMIGTYERK